MAIVEDTDGLWNDDAIWQRSVSKICKNKGRNLPTEV